MTIERDEFNRFADTTTRTLERIEGALAESRADGQNAHSTLRLHDVRIARLESPPAENRPVTRGQLWIVMGAWTTLVGFLRFMKIF